MLDQDPRDPKDPEIPEIPQDPKDPTVLTPDQITPFQLETVKEVLALVGGIDTKAQSLLQELLKIEFIQEKTNFPTAINQQKQTYLLMCADSFGKILGLPFLNMAYYDAIAWRGYKGFNATNSVDILKRGGTDLSGLILQPGPQGQQPPESKRRFWQRNPKTEEQLEG